jgi:protocatechuate 3,4-dioxygenase beta subunit
MRPTRIEQQVEMMRRGTSEELDTRTMADIRAAMELRKDNRESESILEVIMRLMRNGFVQAAVAAVFVAGVVGGIVMMNSAGQWDDGTRTVQPVVTPDEQVRAELAAVQKSYEMKDVKALTSALGTASYDAKVAAANYLAVIGEANSIPVLEKASAEWKGGAGENPFTKAAEAIKTRVKTGTAAPAVSAATVPAMAANTVVAPKAVVSAREGKAITDAESRVLTVKVLDASSGRPLADANVRGNDDKGTTKAQTGADGTAVLKVLRQTKYLRVVATRGGFVGQFATWADEASQNVPAQQTYRLEKAVTIGGVVKNPEGQPLEGAGVEIYRYLGAGERDDGTARRYVRDDQTTDKEGRWRCDVMPADMNNTGMSFSHKEYQTSGWSRDERPEAELRAMKAVMVLQHGLRLYGVVRNTAGQPVKGARVQLGEYGVDATRTGDDGRFDVRTIRLEAQIVTVQSKSYAPVLRQVGVSELAAEQVFVLEKGQVLSGKVVDANGAAVPEAAIYVSKWRGYSSLRKTMKSLKDGTFGWQNAPADAMDITVQAKGYMEAMITGVVADGQEKVFVLSSPVRVRGKVTDAVTGEPVGQFELVPGIAWADNGRSISFQDLSQWVKGYNGGEYDYNFDRFGNCYGVRIVAKGYLPAESRVIEPNERLAICDFALQKSSGARGVVRLPDGKPAAGVTVYMLSRDEQPYLQNGKMQSSSDRPSTKTGADGVFSLAEQGKAYKVGVICDAGLAMVTSEELKQSGEIRLAAWGRVEGQYFTGSKPAAGRKVSLVYQGSDWSGSPDTTTDEEGRFAFTMVRPGMSTIDGRAVDVTPGQTARVVIGGTGRTVKAELVLSGELAATVSERSFSLNVTPRIDEDAMMKLIPMPANIDSMTLAEAEKWYQDYTQTEEGRKLFTELQSQTASGRLYMPVKVDGRTATIEDVPAGLYTLQGQIYQAKANGELDYQKPMALVYHQFEVPEIQEGQLDIPLDLGKVEAGHKAAVGQTAPDFVLEGTDGRKMHLSDYAGKVVLATMCLSQGSPEAPWVAQFKKVYERYGSDSRFAMIGIVPGTKSHPIIRVMVRELALPWPQGYAGSQEATRILNEYGASPAGTWSVLIGADGKIVAVDLKGEELAKKVEEALGK